MNARKKVLLITVIMIILISLFVLLLKAGQDESDSDLTIEPVAQQIDVDPEVLLSAQADTEVSFLREEAPSFPEEVILGDRKALNLTALAEVVVVDSGAYKQELNTLGEPLVAVQSLSLLYTDSLKGILQSGSYDRSEIDTYISLLSFSADYIAGLQGDFQQEKNIMSRSLGEMSQNLSDLLEKGPSPVLSASFSQSSATLNQMIVQIGQDVATRDVEFRRDEPGYLFVFEL